MKHREEHGCHNDTKGRARPRPACPTADHAEHQAPKPIFLASGGERRQGHANDEKRDQIGLAPHDRIIRRHENTDRHDDQQKRAKDQQGAAKDAKAKPSGDGVKRSCGQAVKPALKHHAVGNEQSQRQRTRSKLQRRESGSTKKVRINRRSGGKTDLREDNQTCDQRRNRDQPLANPPVFPRVNTMIFRIRRHLICPKTGVVLQEPACS